MPLVGRAGDEVRYAHVLGDDGILERADLVDHMAVAADGVGSGGEHVHSLALYDEGRHIVGDDGDIEAHVAADRRGQARALKIGARLGAEDADMLPSLAAFAQHHADDRLGKAVRHHRAVLGEQIDKVLTDLRHALVAGVVQLDRFVHDGLRRVLARGEGALCLGKAQVAQKRHALDRRGPRMGNGVRRLPQIFHLLRGSLIAALVRRERHAHRHGGVRSRALRHHVGDGLRNLLMGMAGDKFDPRGIDTSVKYFYFTVLVPRDVFILQHKG